MRVFRFRPHHLICGLCFCGKGYSKKFVKNFKTINKKISMNSNGDVVIQIVTGCDDVCASCPENHSDLCKHEYKVRIIDHAYVNILKLEIGQIIDFDEIKIRIKKKLTMDDFHCACKECSWYKLNICAPIIQEFIGCSA
jgi:uncharacterized protein